ncbi:MAG: hypothetical protein NTX72_01060 [Candidatus Uhrbacteria bacterium]|nr:hypothetical protein [Candidatus Uhrbacteria bacterium]
MRNARMILFAVMLALASVIGGCKKVPNQNGNTTTQSAPAQATPQAQAPAQAAPAAPGIQAKLPGGEEKKGECLKAGMIIWGAEMAAFYGNGGLKTRIGSIYDQYGLCIEFVESPNDNVRAQIDDYKAGKVTFLRGTYPMIGKFDGELCPTPDADLCAEPAVQLTYSMGDHVVCREKIKSISDLDTATVALQKDGPHESFLIDILKDVKRTSKNVKIKFTKDVTAKDGPAEYFKAHPEVDCAFVISPDRDALTGADAAHVGTGAEGTVKGAHVLVSTIDRRTSIPDMYFVSHKFNVEHHDTVVKFAAAFLKSVEAVKALQHDYDNKAKGSEEFRGLLAFTMQTWKDTCPDEAATYGLWSDAAFVGLAGNVEFFNPTSVIGHKSFSNLSNDLAAELDNATKRVDIQSANVEWTHPIFKDLLSGNVKRTAHFNTEATQAEVEQMNQTGSLGGNTMLSFVAYFAENQVEFDETNYKKEFDEVLVLAPKYSRATIVIRGHTDTTLLVSTILKKGMEKGLVKQAGTSGNFTYSIEGKPLDLKNAKQVLALATNPNIDEARNSTDAAKQGDSPSRIAEAATALSYDRAKQVSRALIAYAAKKGVKLDESQITPIGAGASDPFIVKPRIPEEAAKNRRVEFSIVRVSAEAATASDYEL